MENKININELYEKHLLPQLSELESERKKIFTHGLLTLCILAVVLFSPISLFLPSYGHVVLVVIAITGALTSFMFIKKKQVKYKANYKEKIIRKLVMSLNPEWEYLPFDKIDPSIYDNSKIFRTGFDRYTGDDYIIGMVDKTEFEISELHTEYKTRDSEDNSDRWHTIFKGLFFHADFNKNLSAETYVLPDTAERIFGKWGQKFQGFSSKGELVKLENQEFEKEFKVYSNDQVEARYVLTPSMMEAMVNLKKNLPGGHRMNFAFHGSSVYCAIEISKNLFEPNIMKSGMNFKDISIFYQYLGIIELLINELNLNTRIWTKD